MQSILICILQGDLLHQIKWKSYLKPLLHNLAVQPMPVILTVKIILFSDVQTETPVLCIDPRVRIDP